MRGLDPTTKRDRAIHCWAKKVWTVYRAAQASTAITRSSVVVPIAGAVDGRDQAGPLRVDFDSFSELRNLLIERPAVRHVIEATEAIEERVAANDLAALLDQQPQNADL